MKKTICFSFTLFILSIPAVAFGEYYAGVEYDYYSINIDKIDAINIVPNTLMFISDLPPGTPYTDLFPPPSTLAGLFTRVQLLDIYRDHYNGGSLFIGYNFKLPISVEAGYFKSESRKGRLNGARGDIISATSGVSFQSYRFDMLAHFSRPYLGKLNLIGSVGIVLQKLKASAGYLQTVYCIDWDPCSPRPGVEKTKRDDMRIQLGAGASYKFNKHLLLRGMFRFIPAGFSYSTNIPYTFNAGLIYSFR